MISTHVRKSTVKERKGSQLTYHFELVISNRNHGYCCLYFNYVSHPESCGFRLAKSEICVIEIFCLLSGYFILTWTVLL
jgi:hypothetical protein